MVMTRIGGKDYPLYSDPRCKTCQHPDRVGIENALLVGRSYVAILNSLPEDEYKPAYRGILYHFNNGHMPLEAAAQRALIERNWIKQGKAIEDAVTDMVDHVTVAEMVVKRGFERMQAGEISPDMTDTLNAVKIVESIQSRTNADLDQEMWVSATMSMLEDARAIMSAEQWAKYGKKLAANPVLKALAAKNDGTANPEDIPESA